MEIGNQIRTLRLARSITQEEMAQHFGVTPQAVSKWERGTAAPDIALLPEISAYFGVTIDALFALTDDTRMERIENMLESERYLDPSRAEAEKRFLMDKARRETQNSRPHELLAAIELSQAEAHQALAAEYAKEALRRSPESDVHSILVEAMHGKCWDWCESNHHDLIMYYEAFVAEHPDNWHALLWLIDQLVDVGRLSEAEKYVEQLAAARQDWRHRMCRGMLMWSRGQKAEAYAYWEQMARDYPDQWSLWDTIADFLARDEQYDRSVELHRKAMTASKGPHYTDSFISIAQICEMKGDIPAALQAREDQLELLKNEWNVTEGEAVDAVRREMERLKKKYAAQRR